jgi:hypothetical protein
MAMLTTVSTEDLTPADHPIRRIQVVVDEVLASLDGTFAKMYRVVDEAKWHNKMLDVAVLRDLDEHRTPVIREAQRVAVPRKKV